MKPITSFMGEYRWLSNFHVCTIVFEGLVFSSTEAAYQSAKTADIAFKTPFTVMTPSQAKRAGQLLPLRAGWDSMKERIMWDVLAYKFLNHEDLQLKLIETGDAYLEEGNTWGDTYWGVCNGTGRNRLGHLLMEIRDLMTLSTGDLA